MRTLLAGLAGLGVLAAAAAQAEGARARLSFEVRGEAVRPPELSQAPPPNGTLGRAQHGYRYRNCYDYYRWSYDPWLGWQRYYVGTRCY